jgi:hypothetical protein
MLENSYSTQDDSNYLQESDLSTLTIDLCGVILPKPQSPANSQLNEAKKVDPLVLTMTTAKNLHTIGLALSIGAPVLLEGLTGAGKTALVEEVARKVGRLQGKDGCYFVLIGGIPVLTFDISQNWSKFIWEIKRIPKCYWEHTLRHLHLAHLNGNPVFLPPQCEKVAGCLLKM